MKKCNYLKEGDIVYLIRDNKFLKVEVKIQLSDIDGNSSVEIIIENPSLFSWKKGETVKRYQLLSSDDISDLLEERIKDTY